MEQAILWAISLLAFGLFARRTRYLYRLLRLGQPEERTDRPGQRIRHLFTYVLIHRRLFNERGIGIAHTLFFWGFVFYAASFAWLLLKGLLPALPIPAVEEVGPVTLILEVFAVLVLIGLGVAVYRRYIAPPPHLESPGFGDHPNSRHPARLQLPPLRRLWARRSREAHPLGPPRLGDRPSRPAAGDGSGPP
ncbi:MAG: hypothetical protein ACE5LD_04125 [Candidatus Bipolaricaulia bacterium]